jgi:hypothetical protein
MSSERVRAFVESDIAACVALIVNARQHASVFTRSELAGFERWLKADTSPWLRRE